MADRIIELKGICKSFEGEAALDGIDLYIRRREFLTLLGPSGCGKTTMLRIIAGFESADAGDLLFEGVRINDVPPYKRRVNTVFQRYSLFPHLNVFDNIAFGLSIKKIPKQEIQKRVLDMLELVGLHGFEKRKPDSLSGGQQQRVAIARALVNEPEVLLLDEPLAALDLKMRKEMQLELKKMQQRLGITFVYVTHDQEEALTMSDTIVVMSRGQIQQIGTPVDIYNEPINSFVADFIGESNLLEGRMVRDYLCHFAGCDFRCLDKGFAKNEEVEIVVRPEDIDIVSVEKGKIICTVQSIIFMGVHYEIKLLGQDDMVWTVHSTDPVEVGQQVGLSLDPDAIHVMKVSDEPLANEQEEMAQQGRGGGRRMKRSAYAGPYLVWMSIFIVIPLAIVLYYGFSSSSGGAIHFSLLNVGRAFDPVYIGVFLRSVLMAAEATILCLLIGYPLALSLASRNFKKGATILILIVIPMWMNFLLRTYAWMNILNDTGFVAQALRFLGVQDVSLLYNNTAVIVGLVYNFLPFMVLPIYSVLIKIEPHLYEAAEDLGANSLRAFTRVTLPLSMPGVVSGITMCFMPAITTFAVSRLLGGGLVPMYGELIENQFYFMRDWHFGATLSIVMMALVLFSSVLMRKYDKDAQGGMLW